MKKQELLTYLDTYLDTASRKSLDGSKNGLQVETSKSEIKKIWYAVDVSSYIIDKAIDAWVDMMITHHGLYRGAETPLTGMMYERVKKLMDHDIGLYVSHLPLDAHTEVGNNIGLLKGWKRIYGVDGRVSPFGHIKWDAIGCLLEMDFSIPYASLLTYAEQLGLRRGMYSFWPGEIKTVAISSWSGWSILQEALDLWVDLLITGELVHHEIVSAKEAWVNLLLWGHYETEKIGVKLLCYHLKQQFEWLEVVFLDECY